MPGHKTVAIIGAGMAGLAAAKMLSAGGVSVRLFEANGKVGGCCASTRIGGYTFNDGAVYLALPQMLDRLFECLRLDRRRLLPLRRIAALQSTTLPDGTIVEIGSGGSEVAVTGAQGNAGDRLQAEVEAFLKKWEPTLRFFADDILVRPLSLSHLLIKGWPHLAKLRGTVATQLNDSFSNEALRSAFGGALLYVGAPPDRLPAASLLGLVSMLRDGYFLPEGGMGRLPEVLGDALRADGGSLHLDTPVQRILVNNGRAVGIEVKGEGIVEVDAVISTVSAMHTYGSLLSEREVPARLRRRVRRTPLSLRSFVLQLGLANRIEARSNTRCILPWLGEQSQLFKANAGGTRWATYMVPTLTLPELSPSGCSIVEMFPPISQEIPPDDWNEARKKELAASALALLRREHDLDVAVSRILSPKEFQDDTRLFAGALYGVSPAAGPAALFPHRTPIRGLYQAGQTTWPGFGVVSAAFSGAFTAEALIRGESL